MHGAFLTCCAGEWSNSATTLGEGFSNRPPAAAAEMNIKAQM